MKIGLFGGTFDPIHLGHLDMARKVRDCAALDEIVFIPAFIPPHKERLVTADYRDRYAMARLALAGEEGFVLSDVESHASRPSYTYFTLKYFNARFPEDAIYYIMGMDAFLDIQSWFRWQDLLQMAHFIIVDRLGAAFYLPGDVKAVFDQSPFTLTHLALETLPISSSLVRRRLTAHDSVEGLLPEAVARYIADNHLYGW